MFEINQLVILKKDPNKIIYKVKKVLNNDIELTGLYHRTKKHVTINDIELASSDLIKKQEQENEKFLKNFKKTRPANNKFLFGRILHIDGDEEYLNSCLTLYKNIGIKAEGIFIEEKKMKEKIEELLLHLTPDIIVITGHDAFDETNILDINAYENSKVFGEVVRIIRKHFFDVVIIAGACCSHYEYLIAQGANFASSPKRINTHTYDPAVVAIKVASTSVNKMVDFQEIIKYIEGGRDAIGGVQTNGKMRIIY